MFTCKKLRYVWNEQTGQFQKIKTWGIGMPTSSLHCPDAQQGLAGLSINEQRRRWAEIWRKLFRNSAHIIYSNLFSVVRRAIYGPNYINVPVKSISELLLLEVLNPFYIFQVASVIIWLNIQYYYFAGAIAIMSAAGIVISIVQTRKVS